VESWAALNPGSIYNMLRTLSREALLTEVEDGETGPGPARVGYRLTMDGETAFLGLLTSALWEIDRRDPHLLPAALSFLPMLTRKQAIEALDGRTDRLRLQVKAVESRSRALPLGLRAPAGGVLLGIAVVGLLGAAFSAVSYAVALTLKSEDALAPLLNAVAMPVLLLSGILLPMTLAPGWLETLSDVNPLKHVVDGVRAFFRGDFSGGTAWWGLGVTAALVLLGFWFGTRTFRRESA
jgi:DNA-binding PadR family transcriptional regulator